MARSQASKVPHVSKTGVVKISKAAGGQAMIYTKESHAREKAIHAAKARAREAKEFFEKTRNASRSGPKPPAKDYSYLFTPKK